MWENQTPEHSAQTESNNAHEGIKMSYEELERRLAIESGALSSAVTNLGIANDRWRALQNKIKSVSDWIDENLDSLSKDQIEELCDLLDLENSTTKTVTVSVEFSVEVTAPRGFEFDDLSTYDFSATLEQSSSEDWEIENYETDITDVSVDD
jgi:hypothetical protein